jgi:hypothetical protein
VDQAEAGLPKPRKILRIAGWEGPVTAKRHKIQAKVVSSPILRLWLTSRYFTGSVSWVTDLARYLQQDAAGHYEEKMTQISAAKLILGIT